MPHPSKTPVASQQSHNSHELLRTLPLPPSCPLVSPSPCLPPGGSHSLQTPHWSSLRKTALRGPGHSLIWSLSGPQGHDQLCLPQCHEWLSQCSMFVEGLKWGHEGVGVWEGLWG